MSIKILLADDSITIQKVIGIIFGSDDYALTIVGNGKDAVVKAQEIVPDVLLIDALMPGMSGYEVCAAIREIPALAAKPILLLTGSFEPFDEDRANTCGADDFLAKPFESQQIITKVKTLFELGISRASSATLVQPTPEPEAFQSVPESRDPSAIFPTTAAVLNSAEPGDIWGAFTSAKEPMASASPTISEPDLAVKQSNAFADFDQKREPETIQPQVGQASQEAADSQWIPVEEQTFEFEPDLAPQTPAAAFSGLSFSAQEPTFGNPPPAQTVQQTVPVEAPSSAAPVSEPLQAPSQFPAVEAGAPSAAPGQAPLSEEQLRAAISGASRDVIERIVWEIVPDLAESMIRDAILKIQEGR